jgi:hypothetical protein
LTVAIDNPITGEHEALDLRPHGEPEPDGGLLLLPGESSAAIFRGIAYGAVICLCFWIPLAIVVAIVLV